MESRWRVDTGVVIRSPLLPISELATWRADPVAHLAALLARPEIDEAIFVASPSLHGALATWREKPASPAGQRAQHALVKYVARMMARATPFGLFSGVSPGTIGRETRIELAPLAAYRRRTRIDNDYLFVLANELASAHRDRVIVRPNNSLYRIAGRLRCAVARVENKDRRYDLISIDPTPYLEATLARAATGATTGDLAAALVDGEITLEEAGGYIAELVTAQVLVPDLGIYVTGPEPIEGLIAQLRAAELEPIAATLDGVRGAVVEIDGAGLTNPPDRYRAIATTLETLPAKVDLARLFQVDLVKPGEVVIAQRVPQEVLRVVAQLAKLASAEQESLAEFRRAFTARWDDREISLAEALDEEAGIGFEAAKVPGSEGAPLLAGLGFPGGPPGAPPWHQRHLLRRLSGVSSELVLTDADFDAMKLAQPGRLPDAICALVQLTADGSILFEGASGPSGARMHGRFCHASPEIDAMVREHHAREEALAPAAIFAEIVHLNEGRIGNILCRPVLRSHEIVFLGVSGAPRERQIELADLLVSVRGDRIVLRSRRLGREIIPRLTTAHNFRLRSLGVYRFLCAVSGQNVANAVWSWGPLGDAPHLPRVRYGRVVLARETWNLDKKELEPMKAGAIAVAALREAKRLPRFVVLADGDNELPIDLDNPLLVAALADELTGRHAARLVEMLPAPDAVVARGPEGRFACEAILTFVRDGEARAETSVRPMPTLRRRFMPGSEWLYAKIYCGESTADRVLREAIAPIARVHGGPWVFVRYHDPEPHVRVRLHGDPARLLGDVLPALERTLAPLIDVGAARKLVLDTYDRELERYGGDAGIELVEQLFWRDSEAVLGIVELLEGDAGADARWRLAIRGIESLLEALGLSPAERERVVTDGREGLGREMHADTPLWSRIGDRFAKERASLDIMFTPEAERDAAHDLEPGFALLAVRDGHVRAIAAELRARDVRIPDIAWSLVHMHANRLLHASQRAQELVLYDFLRRLHASKRSRRG